MTTPCRACGSPRRAGQYLCASCWSQLPTIARRALSQRGPLAVPRLRQLHAHIDAGHPLADLEIR